jgi:hypothetical protein
MKNGSTLSAFCGVLAWGYGYRACLVYAHKQLYQNWLANFLAWDLAVHGLPKFWKELVNEISSGPLAAK